MRRGFTLIELLTIVAIIAIMVSASLVSVQHGQGAARIRGATRDIFATIRHARSMALVSQQPSIITYSTVKDGEGGEVMAKIDIVTAKMFSDKQVKVAYTLNGDEVKLAEDDSEGEMQGGQTVEDVLFAPISSDVVRGVRIKVTKEGEELDGGTDESRRKQKMSVFSNVDFLLGRYAKKKSEDKAKTDEAAKEGGDAPSSDGHDDQEPVSVVWEANGRTEPHRVWIYRDGTDPEKDGLSIKVDRFGGAKVIGSGERDE